jgi:DeoR family fructose operon transcriptional repressor
VSISKTVKRQAIILRMASSGEANIKALSERFGVSESTIRRDLLSLSESGQLVRITGGALLREAAQESSLNERMGMQRAQKNAIAREANKLIRAGETLLLDAGTTTAALAQALVGRDDLHVITNNLEVMNLLAHEPGMTLTLLGGELRKNSMATMGPLAQANLQRMTADKVFLGADGLVAGRGLCEANQSQVALKELMMQQATEMIVLADATKLGVAAEHCWAVFGERHWTLITDDSASEALLAPFQQDARITIHIAKTGGSVPL